MNDIDYKKMAIEYRRKRYNKFVDNDDFEKLEEFDTNTEESFIDGLKIGQSLPEKKSMKEIEELIRIQAQSVDGSKDDYMAGMYNGMICVYNTLCGDDESKQKDYCSHSKKSGKWKV